MNILALHQHFHPETVGTSTRAVEIVEYLTQRGHSVTVVTGIPSHPSTLKNGEVSRRQPRHEVFRGAHVHRTWAYGSAGPDTFLRRMMCYASFMVTGGILAFVLTFRKKYDVLLVISPLPNGIAGAAISRIRRIPMMFDVCDIWPDVAVAVGMMQPPRLLRIAQKLERWVYRRSTQIGVVTRGFIGNLVAKEVPQEKIVLLPDWVDPTIYDPTIDGREALRKQLDFSGKYVAAFLGNFGLIMGLEKLMDMAAILKQTAPDVLVLFVGKGVALPMMEQRIRDHDLTNVRIIPYRPREEVPLMLAGCDALLVTYMDNPITRITVPSKIYEYLAMERPIIAGTDGVLADILTESGAAIISRSRDPQELANAVLAAKADPMRASAMGKAGRHYVMQHFTFEKVSGDYEAALQATAPESR